MIKAIYVSEPTKQGKEKKYDIDIVYHFQKPSLVSQTKENTVLPDTIFSDSIKAVPV